MADRITISHLLYQTSGFNNNEKYFPAPTLEMTLEENIRQLSERALVFETGSHFTYANSNYNLLGFIIQQASGLSYADFMEARIFKPLGLYNTYADIEAGKARASLFRGRGWAF